MFSNACTRKILAFLLTIAVSTVAPPLHAAMEPRFELNPRALEATSPASKPAAKSEKPATKSDKPETKNDKPGTKSDKPATKNGKAAPKRGKHAARPRSRAGQQPNSSTTYIVKPGDNLQKILVRDFGLRDSEAGALIDDICRKNNIQNFRRLKVGQRIEFASLDLRTKNVLAAHETNRPAAAEHDVNAPTTLGQVLSLPVPSQAAFDEQETLRQIKDVWDKIVLPKNEASKPLAPHSSTFSLALDPKRFPMYATMNGGRILVDSNNALPPLIKALIEKKEPTIQIISKAQTNTKQLLTAMLETAGFYSVEENFNLEFGTDPKVTVHSDFKIEKAADSLINQDVVLLNDERHALPSSLREVLQKNGFSVYEPFAAPSPLIVRPPRNVAQIEVSDQPGMVDAILGSLAVSAERDRTLDVFGVDGNGISLSFKADRSFVRNGQKYVITQFDGDAVTYTLFRILETKGYRVIILDKNDGFRKSVEKILTGMKIQNTYGRHDLIREESLPYSVQMTGFWLDDPSLPNGNLFLTNLAIDGVARSLLLENGFNINTK